MFIISRKNDKAIKVLAKLRKFFLDSNEITCGTIYAHQLNGYWLHWFNCKPSDNLHIFEDGVVIGKMDFAEVSKNTPTQHLDVKLPKDLHPLLNATTVNVEDHDVIITPNQTTNIFVSPNGVSDMQLLLADLENVLPDAMHIAVLSSVGYLPGNLTLFADIEKIPFLNCYNISTQVFRQMHEITYQANDDNALLERLIELVPDVPSHLGISGGYDSRFVLGCLLKAGIQPQLLHISSPEESVVQSLANELSLELTIEDGSTSLLPPDIYTIMTDGQIYFRGGGYSKLRNLMESNHIFHMGLFSVSIIKNAFKTAWKIPSRIDIQRRLISYALLSNCPSQLKSFVEPIKKTVLHEFLFNQIIENAKVINFQSDKQWANWFYYLHRGVRWSYSTTADLSFYTYPVFLLSDFQAQLLGISSSAWSNFHKDRVRDLNHKLMPLVKNAYDDGGEVTHIGGLGRHIDKVKYEYFDRLLARQRGRKEFATKATTATSLLNQIPDTRHTVFSHYFSGTLKDVLEMDVSYAEKRSCITLYYVMDYLGRSISTESEN